MYDVVIVAHFALDVIIKDGERRPLALGGPPLYGSITVQRLGGQTGVISKVGEDFREEYMLSLSRNGIDISGVTRCPGPTTRFMLNYEGEERTEFLMAKCERIEIQDIPRRFLQTHAFVVSPIIDEMPLETLKYIAEKGKGPVYLDPSGYIRAIAPNGSGKIRLTEWKDMAEYLPYINVLKASVSEMHVLTACKDLKVAAKKMEEFGAEIIIITEGSKGSYIQYEGNFIHIPPVRSEVVVDATGAGDVYLSAFALEYSRTHDVVWSGAFATAAVSSKIKGQGISALQTRDEIEKIARKSIIPT